MRPGAGTLIALRLHLPHQALAVLLRVDRATITRAIGQIRPPLAAGGFAHPVGPGRMHDQTAVKTEGIADPLPQHPGGQGPGR